MVNENDNKDAVVAFCFVVVIVGVVVVVVVVVAAVARVLLLHLSPFDNGGTPRETRAKSSTGNDITFLDLSALYCFC